MMLIYALGLKIPKIVRVNFVTTYTPLYNNQSWYSLNGLSDFVYRCRGCRRRAAFTLTLYLELIIVRHRDLTIQFPLTKISCGQLQQRLKYFDLGTELECKLKSSNENERFKAVSLLNCMFSENNSNASKKPLSLLRMFFGRFCDIAVSIRVKCVQSSMHFLVNQPHLRKDIIDSPRAYQHFSDENVCYEVVMAVLETAKRELKIVCESEDLLGFLRECTFHNEFKIRKEAMFGLGFIFKHE